jgi:hypothetical protein
MTLTKCSVTTDVIGSIGTTVQERGMTTQEFKDAFDQMPEGIKTYLNDTLTVEIDKRSLNAKTDNYTVVADDLNETITMTGTKTVTLPLITTTGFGAGFRCRISNVGTGTVTVAATSTDTIAGAASVSLAPKKSIEVVADAAGVWAVLGFDFTELISTHTGKAVSRNTGGTRDISVAGTQTIALPFRAKNIRINVEINGTQKASWGSCDADLNQSCMMMLPPGNISGSGSSAILLNDGAGNQVTGTITAIDDTSITITWAKTGSPTGTAVLFINATTH